MSILIGEAHPSLKVLRSGFFHVGLPGLLLSNSSQPLAFSVQDANYPILLGANVSETTNRTAWTTTGGSLRLHVGHHWALTYVNLGLGNNVTNFNISLVDHFNQTGNGTFCLKETGKAQLAAGLSGAGYDAKSVDGVSATLQVIQISTTGAALYNVSVIPLTEFSRHAFGSLRFLPSYIPFQLSFLFAFRKSPPLFDILTSQKCADITFNATAALLADSECANSTDVGGIGILNADQAGNTTATSTTSAGAASTSTGAASALQMPALGGVIAAVIGFGIALT